MAYHKKRIAPAPNKNAAKVLRRENLASAEVRIDSFRPRVDRIMMQMDFYDARGNFLDQRSQSFGSNDTILLQIDCVGPCGNGKINLEEKIQDMIRKRESVSDGRARCAQTLYAGSSELCGHELRCHTEIHYGSTQG